MVLYCVLQVSLVCCYRDNCNNRDIKLTNIVILKISISPNLTTHTHARAHTHTHTHTNIHYIQTHTHKQTQTSLSDGISNSSSTPTRESRILCFSSSHSFLILLSQCFLASSKVYTTDTLFILPIELQETLTLFRVSSIIARRVFSRSLRRNPLQKKCFHGNSITKPISSENKFSLVRTAVLYKTYISSFNNTFIFLEN